MSRIGKAVIEIPEGVKADVSDSRILISGPKGELDTPIFIGTKVKLEENLISIYLEKDKEVGPSKWGLQRSLIYNSVIGVSEGYSKRLLFRDGFSRRKVFVSHLLSDSGTC